jgi:hypothetical protein
MPLLLHCVIFYALPLSMAKPFLSEEYVGVTLAGDEFVEFVVGP